MAARAEGGMPDKGPWLPEAVAGLDTLLQCREQTSTRRFHSCAACSAGRPPANAP